MSVGFGKSVTSMPKTGVLCFIRSKLADLIRSNNTMFATYEEVEVSDVVPWPGPGLTQPPPGVDNVAYVTTIQTDNGIPRNDLRPAEFVRVSNCLACVTTLHGIDPASLNGWDA
jgi:hypothetical protein